MSDVDWITVEQVEGEFFATRHELMASEELGELDTKVIEIDGKNRRLFMRHQIIQRFDARDLAVKLRSKDIVDVAKDVVGEGLKYSLAAGFGALAIQLKTEKSDANLVSAYSDVLRTYDPDELKRLAWLQWRREFLLLFTEHSMWEFQMAIKLTDILKILSDYGLTLNDFCSLEPIRSKTERLGLGSVYPQGGWIPQQQAVHLLLNLGAVTVLADKPFIHQQEYLSAPVFDTSGEKPAGSDWIVRYQDIEDRWVHASIHCTPWFPNQTL